MSPALSPLSPAAEAKRLKVLRRYEVLGTPPDETFERLAHLAGEALGTAGAAISFVGERRVFYQAVRYAPCGAEHKAEPKVERKGVGRSFPRAQTPCTAAAFAAAPLIFEDVTADVTDAHLAFIRHYQVRFYVGLPLSAPDGTVLGTLSVFDPAPRTLTATQIKLLETLAQTVMGVLEQRREALKQLQAAKAEGVRELLTGVPYYALSVAADGRLDYLNDALGKALGYRSLPAYYAALYPPDAQGAAVAALARARQAGRAELETTFQTGSGTRIPVVQTLTRTEYGVSVLAYDTPEQRENSGLEQHRLEQRRREQKRAEVLQLTARGAPLPAVLLELLNLLETSCSGMVGAVFLVQQGTLQLEAAPQLPSAFAELVRELPLSAVAAAPGVAVREGKTVVTADIRRDPVWHHLRYFALQSGLQACWAEPILSDQAEVLGAFALYAREPKTPTEAESRLLRETAQLAGVAVSRRKLYAQLEAQALHDALTGLPNRRLLGEHLERAVQQAAARRHAELERTEGVGVLLLDLDNFKRVNDALGHPAGDALLGAVVSRLQEHVQAQLPLPTTLARSGGDEFVLTVPLAHPSDAARFAFELQRAFTAPFTVGERTLQISASIGVSRYPEDAATPEALLQAADTAMYAAKADRQAGREQGYRLYQSEMTAQLEAQLRLEAELKRALAQDEFRVFAQPRFDLKTQRVSASEVLVRWAHPGGELLLPGAFLGSAQQAGLLPQLDAWVLRRAAHCLISGAAAGNPLHLSCNVSAASFQDAAFLRELETVLGEHPAVPAGLELEITESLLMQNLDGVAARLADLKVRFPGIRVAIDDFGSGYSSLAYLRHLPLDTLKIDRAFVRDLDHRDSKLQRTALAVIRTIIALGHDLGFRVVAEGAESEGQLGMLTALGVDEVQGFAIGKPQPLNGSLREPPGDSLTSSKFS